MRMKRRSISVCLVLEEHENVRLNYLTTTINLHQHLLSLLYIILFLDLGFVAFHMFVT